MGLIRDLQNDLLDPSIKLPNALRKAQVLAYRLGSDDLRTWTDGELNGYPTMDVPRIPHLAQTSDAVNRQLSCFSSRYMNLLAVFQI